MEGDLIKMMERKANFIDVQEALTHKADLRDISTLSSKSDTQEMVYKIEKCCEDLNAKLDQRDFDEFDELLRKKIEEL